jgi:hypothetical protein
LGTKLRLKPGEKEERLLEDPLKAESWSENDTFFMAGPPALWMSMEG